MLNSLKFFIVTLVLTFSLVSCTKDDTPDPVTAKDIEVTSTSTSDAITLSWKPINGVSWYTIYIGKKGESPTEIGPYQNLINNPITYKIPNLEPNTVYDIKMEGKDYAYGGDVLAVHNLSVSTLAK
ncbi:MAG: fibronectin type III domain-containing protein [Sporocytophaga sp.]|uniref:fibronectin type III domain-containing protein n=1 Tax=Sporocytophaga sp. TaxID=2231183 RepID=UPI001B0B512C|nr:fibronectin type III domain-containing protein [Sporocytophaga sp.]MBO9699070.1 fibronectin type III domain-containing protein [Sporocytophaga sp.]